MTTPNTPALAEMSASGKRLRDMDDDAASEASAAKRGASEEPSSSASSSSPPHQPASSSELDGLLAHTALGRPSPAEQRALIEPLLKRPLVEGDTWYLVERWWWRRFLSLGERMGEDCAEGEDEGEDAQLGPVDNSRLANEQGALKTNPVVGVDVELVPEDAWAKLSEWYGATPAALPRKVVKTSTAANSERVEFFSPTFTIYSLSTSSSQPSTPSLSASASTNLTLSSAAPLTALLALATGTLYPAIASSTPPRPSRLWRLPKSALPYSGPIPPSKLREPSVERIDASSLAVDGKKLWEALLEDGGEFVLELQDEDGSWLSEREPEKEPKRAPLFAAGSDFVTKLQQNIGSKPAAQPPALPPVPQRNAVATRSQAAFGKPKGLVGLQNLGNTCFMNSALQCLSNTKELMVYFLSGIYESELNPDNPLGMSGQVAESFGQLIKRLWAGGGGAIAPREFKMTLSKFAPSFSGYAQHDTQELLAFLLDGLHEDLNRIQKKPYTEIPDWMGGGDEEVAKFAQLCWELYKKRNDSVIVDLFQGQFKSTVVCPECSKVSITFDPFMYLTLPLPITKKWQRAIYFVPMDVANKGIKISIEMPVNSSMKALKKKIGELVDVKPSHLWGAEIYGGGIFKVYKDDDAVTEIGDRDDAYFYELPIHVPQDHKSKERQKRIDEAGYVVFPVYHAYTPEGGSSYKSLTAFGHPLMLALPLEQAHTPDDIRVAITRAYGRYSDTPEAMWVPAAAARELKSREAAEQQDDQAEDDEGESVTQVRQVQEDGEMVAEIRVNGDASSVTEVPASAPQSALSPPDVEMAGAPSPAPAAADVAADADADAYIAEADSDERVPDPRLFRMCWLDHNKSRDEIAEGRIHGKLNAPDLAERFGWIEELRERHGVNAKAKAADTPVTPGGFPATPPDSPPPAASKPPTAGYKAFRFGDAVHCEWTEDAYEHLFGASQGTGYKDKTRFELDWEVIEDPAVTAARQTAGAGKKKRAISIEECMDEFCKEEQLGEDDLWYCSNCKKHQQATKKFDLWKVPDVLVVHLKRFSSSRISRDKIDAFVDFPLEDFNIEERVGERHVAKSLRLQGKDPKAVGIEDADEPLVYDLYAIDNHYGGLGGGHYTAFAKNTEDGSWHHFDDSSVSKVDADNVKTTAAYLLFYRRRTTRPIGGAARLKAEEVLRKSAQASPVSGSPVATTSSLPAAPGLSSAPHSPSSSTPSLIGPQLPGQSGADFDTQPDIELPPLYTEMPETNYNLPPSPQGGDDSPFRGVSPVEGEAGSSGGRSLDGYEMIDDNDEPPRQSRWRAEDSDYDNDSSMLGYDSTPGTPASSITPADRSGGFGIAQYTGLLGIRQVPPKPASQEEAAPSQDESKPADEAMDASEESPALPSS